MLAFSLAFIAAPLAGTAIHDRWGGEALWIAIGCLGPPLGTTFWLLSDRLDAGSRDRSGPADAPDRAGGARDSH